MRDSPGLRVAQKEEENRSRQASENAPPAVVFNEEKTEMASRDRDDCGGLQPVSVVNNVRCVRISMSFARQLRSAVRAVGGGREAFLALVAQLAVRPAMIGLVAVFVSFLSAQTI
jgi:hypothetical protein